MDVTQAITSTTTVDWGAILSAGFLALQAIIIGWFGYNQYTKNKKADSNAEMDKIRKEMELELLKERKAADSQNLAVIYSELYELLQESGADRVYIVQPHPPHDEHLLSVSVEVLQKGVSPIKSSIQNIEFAELPILIKKLATNCWNFFATIDDFSDSKAQSIARIHGIYQAACKKMTNSSGVWVGNLFVDFNSHTSISEQKLKSLMKDHANTIQHILPQFKV